MNEIEIRQFKLSSGCEIIGIVHSFVEDVVFINNVFEIIHEGEDMGFTPFFSVPDHEQSIAINLDNIISTIPSSFNMISYYVDTLEEFQLSPLETEDDVFRKPGTSKSSIKKPPLH